MRFKKSMLEIASILDETIAKGEQLTRTANMTLAEMHRRHRDLVKSLEMSGPRERALRCQALANLSRQILKAKRDNGLIKSISFNPLEPHDMNVESTYYSPYRLLSDGSYAPHDKGYWMQQAPQLHADGEFGGQQMRILSADEERMRDDGYSEVSKFYRAAGVFKSELYSEIDELVKAIQVPRAGVATPASGKPRGLPVGTIHDWQGVRYQKQGDGQWLPVQQGKGPHPVEQDAQAKQKKLQQIIKDRTEGRAKEPGLDDRARKATEKANEVGAKEADLERRDREAKDRDLSHREEGVKTKEKELGEHAKLLEQHSKKAPLEAQFCGTECQSELKKKTSRREKGKGEAVKLSKAELAHTLQHGRFAMISAGKNLSDKKDSQLSDADVKKRHAQLEKELKDAGYAYTRTKGHYGGEEDSFMVMVHEADRAHMLELGKQLKQDSVIYSEKGKHEQIYTSGDKAGQHYTGEGFEEKANADDYFTEFKHDNGQKTKFSLKFDWSNLHGDAKPKKPEPLPTTGIYTPEDSLGIKRSDMPQVSSRDMPDFFSFLSDKGIKFSSDDVKVKDLKPSQAEVNASVAAKLSDDQAQKSIITSNDGFVIDGHHRWYNKLLNKVKFASAVKIDMSAKDLIKTMKDFGKVGMVDVEGRAKPTDAVFKRDGKYIGERRKIHERILKGVIDGVKSIPPPGGHKPVAVFTAGGPGSGKSSMVKAAHEKFGSEMAQIAADEVKKEIPEYSSELARGNEDAAILVHEESTDIAAEAIERCIEGGKPFLLDSTFKNVPKFKKLISKLREKGYEVHVLYAHCHEEEAVRRAKKRQEETGRKVDERVVREGNGQAKNALYELGGLADSTAVFNTMSKGAPPPELMFHHRADDKEDFSRVKDFVKSNGIKLYDRFLDQIKTGEYDIEDDDDESEIPVGERLKYEDEPAKKKKHVFKRKEK